MPCPQCMCLGFSLGLILNLTLHCQIWPLLGAAAAAAVVHSGTPGIMLSKGSDFFTYVSEEEEELAFFDGAMTGFSNLTGNLAVEAHDWGRYSHVVDVGGGHGALLKFILKANPGKH